MDETQLFFIAVMLRIFAAIKDISVELCPVRKDDGVPVYASLQALYCPAHSILQCLELR